jgi:hypothetical protein
MLNVKVSFTTTWSYDKFDCIKGLKPYICNQLYHNQLRMNKAISGFSKLSKEEKNKMDCQ